MAETSTAAPASHSQPSRKGKKAWRKNVDLSEVQTGLETVRDEIIRGGVIAEKPSEQLFVTDLLGDENVSRQQKSQKLLKADEILAQRSAVPGLDGRKRKAADVDVPSSSKKHKNGTYVPHKDLRRLKEIADQVRDIAVQEPSADHDPWAPAAIGKDERLTFIEEVRGAKEPKTLKYESKPLTVKGKHIPNVRKPEAGKSYNPLVQDWSALMEREGAAAVEAEKKRLQAEVEAEEKEARALEEAAKVEAAEKDEYATDYDSAWESEWEGFQSGAEEEVHTQKMPKRKTPAERNKVKARKERERLERHQRKQREREEQEKRIAQIAKEYAAKGKQQRSGPLAPLEQDSDSTSDDDVAEPELQRRRFGQLQIPDAPLEVVLPDELEDSLRRLKPEGNLLTDRYRNLLINGKVEMRKKQWQRKQAKVDTTEKWSYKDWKLR